MFQMLTFFCQKKTALKIKLEKASRQHTHKEEYPHCVISPKHCFLFKPYDWLADDHESTEEMGILKNQHCFVSRI